ncbi:N-acetylglucosamine-6-phosphate deacetylase [Sphingomonas sp. LM7]|uniref:N-acetylglucosamine-6-phosphate deacetylase n=1 Tax=Sphingomonas sp. LM7 TaxID=1938607 RepID=UPI000983B742|nr:N-acetylglucosamine-6-phosphate deacetylase [Sphingomonas sp. LM7]AQR73397.1 N-acetylglucosamine-6-phosphate deacetylase [Sphingomonas sp. LM7]
MKISVANGNVVAGRTVLDAATIAIVDGRISAIEPGVSGELDIDLDGGWLVPGFIDVQVNGGGGVLFNDDISVDAIAAIGAAHGRFGTTAFLPTLISDSSERIAAALDAADAAIAAGVPGVVGVHIEGPFINAAKRGIHEADRIVPIDAAMVELLCRPRAGRVVLTVAPEMVAPAFLRTLVRHGVLVCAGHTNATYDEVRTAVDAGVTGFTHLFNAMSPLTHRAPGAVGAALDLPGTWCGLIVDNAHLHPATVRIAIRAKGVDRIMLVTDAMPSVGTDQAAFVLQGKRIQVRDGVCTYEDGTLAGSDLDMAAAFRNTVSITGLAPAEVVRMSSESAAAFLGLSATHGTLAPGKRADWVVLDADLAPCVTWIGGVPMFAPAELGVKATA